MEKGTRDIYVHVNVSKSTDLWPQRDAKPKYRHRRRTKTMALCLSSCFSLINCGFPIIASMIDRMSLEGQSNHGFNDWWLIGWEACSHHVILNESGWYRYRKTMIFTVTGLSRLRCYFWQSRNVIWLQNRNRFSGYFRGIMIFRTFRY